MNIDDKLKEEIDSIWKLISIGDSSGDIDESDRIYNDAIQRLENILQSGNSQNGTLNYLIGYSWYNLSDTDETRTSNTEKYLLKAYELDNKNMYAPLYLLHHYYDIKKYREALALSKSIDLNFFLRKNQLWRKLKAIELILCCKFRLNANNIDDTEISTFMSLLKSTPEEDQPIPYEIDETLKTIDKNSSNNPKLLEQLTSFITSKMRQHLK